MKTKQDKLYNQVWRNPIVKGQLLSIMKAEDWHTFTVLSMFINKNNKCHPSIYTLKKLLGLKDLGSVSRRLSSLEKIRFEGEPIVKVTRGKEKSASGKIQFVNNKYWLNPKIITIFKVTEEISIWRKQQMEKFNKDGIKLINSLSMDAKRTNA